MTGLNHITAGRTTIRALLLSVVLTAAIVGAVGTSAADVIDGKGNDPLAVDSLDGKGNDPITFAFPINNVTVAGYQTVGIERLSSASLSLSDVFSVPDTARAALIWPQDMDPY